MYYADGNEPIRINGFGQWRVIDETGEVFCMFYGPDSFEAACNYCRDRNRGSVDSDTLDRVIKGVPVNRTLENGGIIAKPMVV